MKKFLKILIIIFIILGIVSMWVLKNYDSFNKQPDVGDGVHDISNIEEPDVGDGVHAIPNIEEPVAEDGVHDISNVEQPVVEDDNHNIPNIEQPVVGDGAHDIPNLEDSNFILDTPSFDVEVLTSYGLPILLDFGAEWCAPCNYMHPILEELNNELRGKAIVKYVDLDKYPEIAKEYNFSLIPTQYFINIDGEIYKSHTGIISKEEIIGILKEMGMEE